MIKDKVIGLKVSQKYFTIVKRLAEKEGMSVPDFVRIAIEEAKSKREEPVPLITDPLLRPLENESSQDTIKRIDHIHATPEGRELLSKRRKYFLKYYTWPSENQLKFD